MSEPTNSLTSLVNVLNEGIVFYNEASLKTSNHVYLDVFERMSHLKSGIAEDMNAELALKSEQTVFGRIWPRSFHISYAELLVEMSEHPSHEFIGKVEAQEERLLNAFQMAANSDGSEQVRQLANMYLPELRRMHCLIKELKEISALESIKN